MSEVTEHVNIENLLVQAMQEGSLPLPDDPLPSAEEIAGAKAAAATAHSTCSAAVATSHPIKGLGGAGLSLKRKNGSKAGNSSTISAATAPPAVFGASQGPGRGAVRGAVAGTSSSNLSSKPAAAGASSSSNTAEKGPASGASALPGAADKAESSPSVPVPPESGRVLRKDAAGVQSFRPVLSPDSEHGSSSEWESASQDEEAASGRPVAAKLAPKPTKLSSSTTSWGSSCISSVLDDWVDPTTLAVCGVVLGACAGALLVLGAKVWMGSRTAT